MKKYRLITLLILTLALYMFYPAFASELPEKDQPVVVLTVQGAIFSATARYIERGIKQAEYEGAICIIEMDTPGGLITSMREIIETIMKSKVPVIVYVYPQGGMATSAGTYITYASHLAAMAPGTHIGSAHPVGIGYDNKRWKNPAENPDVAPIPIPSQKPEDKNIKSTPKPQKKNAPEPGGEVDVGLEKATNAMVALIRSLAEKNHRNADWGEKSVRESVSVTAIEARKLGVVEIIAEDLPDLLKKIKGKKVTLEGNKTVTLAPSQNIKHVRMSGIERFLIIINDPQIAVILMFLGTIGLYFELSTPGAVIPGVIGGICIILGLYTLGSLPINYAALGLIIFSVILFIAEVFTPTYGALTLGGIISFVLGTLFLIPAGIPYLHISRTLIASIATTMGILSLVIFKVVLKSLRSKPFSGIEGIAGKYAVAKTDLKPDGMVLFQGELWKAKSTGEEIPAGSRVAVKEADGLLLIVEKETEAQQE